MKKTFLLPLLLISLVFIVSGCGPKKINLGPIVDPSIVQEVAPSVISTTTEDLNDGAIATNEDDKVLNCGSNRSCFLARFLKCQSAEFKTVSGNGEFQISIIGLAGDRCYYLGGLYEGGVLVGSGMECRVPKHLITANTLDHFLGQDKAAGKEDIKLEQDRIENDYCSRI